jgi:signal peptidase II
LKVLYITFFTIFADQVTKLLVKGFNIPFLGFSHRGMELYSSIDIIGDFFRFTYVENPGMAFGINFGGELFFCFFRFAAGIVILYYLYKVRNKKLLLRIPLALILAGDIGNLIDRMFYGVFYNEAPLFYGKVVDFISIKIFKIDFFGFYMTRWPVFNISDIAITVGIFLIVIFYKKIYENDDSNSEPVLPAPVSELQKPNN